MRPEVAYVVTDMMRSVVTEGTASTANVLKIPIAGKTGTSNDARDTWFLGLTPDYAIGVWIGFDDNRSLGGGEAGAATAVPIFTDFMQVALKERPARPFVRPKNAVFRTVNGIEEAYEALEKLLDELSC